MGLVRAAVMAAALWLGASGCAAQTANDENLDSNDHSNQTGAGTLLYVRHQLRELPAISGRPALVSVVVGLSNVEVLTEDEGGSFSVQSVAGPPAAGGCARSPIQLAVNDVNGDGFGDLVVMDTCGNWLALADQNGGYRGVAIDPALAALETWESFAAITFDDGTDALIGGADLGGTLATRASTQEPFGPLQHFSVPPQVLVTPVMRTFSALEAWPDARGGKALLYQSRGALQVLQLEGAELKVSRTLSQVVHAPYLVPFDGFDHLMPLEMAGCGAQALGVSLFSSDVEGVPRALQRLELGAATYEPNELSTSGEVVTFGAVVEATSAVVGLIERRGDGHAFVVYRITACQGFQKLGERPIDFDWRMPPARAFSGGSVPRTAGVQLLGAQVTSGVAYRFYEYDGYVLRIFHVTLSAPTDLRANINVEELSLHETRTDLAY